VLEDAPLIGPYVNPIVEKTGAMIDGVKSYCAVAAGNMDTKENGMPAHASVEEVPETDEISESDFLRI
jgi:hypothetical protein